MRSLLLTGLIIALLGVIDYGAAKTTTCAVVGPTQGEFQALADDLHAAADQ